MADRIYPTELQLNKANSYGTVTLCFDLNLCIYNGTVSTTIYDKRNDFDIDTVNFPFLDCFSPAYIIWGIHISTYLIRKSFFIS